MEFLERLNSPTSMKSVIPYYGSNMIDDSITFLKQAENYLTKFPLGNSDVFMDNNYMYFFFIHNNFRPEFKRCLVKMVRISH